MTCMGRPTVYRPNFCERAHNYCRLGAINDELAGFFGVCPRTIDNWMAVHPDFKAAVQSGRVIADAKVARGLYTRAVGYERKVGREIVVGDERKRLTTTMHYPPNVQACMFWLRNRRRQTWRDGPSDPSTHAFDGIAQPMVRGLGRTMVQKDNLVAHADAMTGGQGGQDGYAS
jgi:hypothetical protein